MQQPLRVRRSGNLLFAAAVILIFCLARHYRESAQPVSEPAAEADVLTTGPEYGHIVGFGGPVPVKIILDPDSGTIRAVDFPPNAEDADYWKRVLDSGVFRNTSAKPRRKPPGCRSTR